MQSNTALEIPSGIALTPSAPNLPSSAAVQASFGTALESLSTPATAALPPATRSPIAGRELPPILVADDDADDVFFVQRLIKKTGVLNRVLAFDDGSEVVNYLSRARLSDTGRHQRVPLLLFLDLKMRGLGGFGFLEWARQHRELSPLTIVVLSNSSEPADMQRALELGAHRYLVKYPSAQTFDTIIRSVYPQTVY